MRRIPLKGANLIGRASSPLRNAGVSGSPRPSRVDPLPRRSHRTGRREKVPGTRRESFLHALCWALIGALSLTARTALAGAEAAAEAAATAESAVTVIRGATILTVTKGTIEGGTVIIRGGKIEAVGKDIPPPEGARIIEARKKFLVPGLVDVQSTLGLRPRTGASDGGVPPPAAGSGAPIARVADSLWYEDPAMLRAVAGGVTTVQIMSGSASVIGELTAILKLKVGAGRDGMLILAAPVGLEMTLRATPRGSGTGVAPRSTAGSAKRAEAGAGTEAAAALLRDAFAGAREYDKARREYELRRGMRGRADEAPVGSQRLGILAGVLAGTVRAQVRCTGERETEALLEAANACGFKPACVYGAAEVIGFAEALRSRGTAVAVAANWWEPWSAGFDSRPDDAAVLFRRGVTTALTGDSRDLVPHLNQEAAREMRWGDLSRDEALALVTIGPARIVGLDTRIGSIEPGKDADMVLFDRDPTSIYSRVEKTMIDGIIVYDADRDYDRFVVSPQALAAGGSREAVR